MLRAVVILLKNRENLRTTRAGLPRLNCQTEKLEGYCRRGKKFTTLPHQKTCFSKQTSHFFLPYLFATVRRLVKTYAKRIRDEQCDNERPDPLFDPLFLFPLFSKR